MIGKQQPVLVLALGNDILGDDAIALTACRILAERFPTGVDFEETTEAGLAILDILSGYEYLLLLDSITTEKCPPGTVLEFTRVDFDKVLGPSPHYAGLPEILELARRLEIPFPVDIRVLALEIENPYDFSENLTPTAEQALPGYVEKACHILHQWIKPEALKGRCILEA